MSVSGVVVACRPQHLAQVAAGVEALAWAQVHHRDTEGRLVVTIDADNEGQSAARLLDLQRLPHVLMAEMVQYVINDDQP
jgi:nitrate reductase NapAB chaperone NapD